MQNADTIVKRGAKPRILIKSTDGKNADPPATRMTKGAKMTMVAERNRDGVKTIAKILINIALNSGELSVYK